MPWSVAPLVATLFLVTSVAFAQDNKVDAKTAAATVVTTDPARLGSASTSVVAPKPAQPAEDTTASEPEEAYQPALAVGDATQGLLAWQRSGDVASRVPRPIAGNVASRSYERYIKSFEHPIPERLGSTVANPNNGAGGNSTSKSR
ncbi:DUF3613 domain-containing protein [Acidovorax cavernicola]|uniref:DUF3613 domain-containing protein n=2 Tax=Acidovorax cavernicola TaxID=1675792 RepID=A0A9X8D7U9_9BURK|nr:DUF3613 domain-containing protein [Acidovorax cavernicola]